MKRYLALLISVLMLTSVFSGCTKTAEPETVSTDPVATDTPSTTPAPVTETSEKVFYTYMSADCPTLNNQDCVDGALQTPYDYCSATLYRKIMAEDKKSFTYLPDIAESEPVQIDAKNWQIKIRQGAKWQNGDPINADTFMYTFKMNLDPILANQMQDYLASISVTIVNAKEYMLQGTSNTVSWDSVGFKKIDDYTIQLTTVDENTAEQVMNQFTDRSCFPVYEPLYEAGMNETRTATTYGKTANEWMGCGPYTLETWDFDSQQVYVKNPDYWHADLFHYDRVIVRIIPTMNARVELWEKGELDYLSPDSKTIETFIDDPRLAENIGVTVTHFDINDKNTDSPILQQLDFRKALYHACDREILAELAGYQIPAGFYINMVAGMYGPTGVTYRETPQGKSVTELIESWGPNGYNAELAKEYFDKAYAAAGCTGVVTMRMMYEDNYSDFEACTEYLQQALPEIFGKDKFAIEAVPASGGSTAYKAAVGSNGWDLSWNDWGAASSRTMPYTSFRYFISTYASRPNSYTNAEFDAQYAVCDSSEVKTDYERLMDETAKLETIYLDKVIQVPIFQTVAYDMFSDRIELPVSIYVPGFGWGQIYGDIAD